MSLIRIGGLAIDPADVSVAFIEMVNVPPDAIATEHVHIRTRDGAVYTFGGKHLADAKAWLESVPEFAAAPRGLMTVQEAQHKHVCRICGEPDSVPMTYHFGCEHAHTECLQPKSSTPTNYWKGEPVTQENAKEMLAEMKDLEVDPDA